MKEVVPVTGRAPVSPDGRWWWDGARWVPTTKPSVPRGGVIVHVALALALLAGYGTMMMLIGVADYRVSGIAFGASDALMAMVVGLLPAVPGVIAFVRLPRGDALRIEALLAIAIGVSLSVVLLLAMFVG